MKKTVHHTIDSLVTILIPALILLILGLCLYGLTVKGVYGKPPISSIKNNLDQATKPFELSPERGRYAMVVSLSEDHTFALRPELGLMVFPDVGYYKGKFFSYFAPGISILALPFYEFGLKYNIPQVASYFVIAVFASFNLALIYVIGRKILKLPMWAAFFSALVFGFGSVSWSYAITMYQHHVTTFFILSSFFATWKIHNKSRLSALWAALVWFNFGYAVLIDYPNVLLMAPVMIYFAFSGLALDYEKAAAKIKISFRPEVVCTVFVLVIMVVLHGYYNYVNFGDWKRVSGSLPQYRGPEVQTQIQQVSTSSGSFALTQSTSTSSAEAAITEQGNKDPVKFFAEQKTPVGFYVLLFSPDRGLFLYSPIFILGFLGLLLMMIKGNKEHATMIASVVILIFLYSSWGDPWGGWAFGPRYLIPALSILSLGVSYWFVHGKLKFLSKVVAFILVSYSIAVSMLGAFTTNAIPPMSEAVLLHIGYNFLQNLNYYIDGHSGSFVYNYLLSPYITLGQLTGIIWGFLCLLCFFVLFILPFLTKKYDR